jgi:phosphotransferase system HPr (HPr) family protein
VGPLAPDAPCSMTSLARLWPITGAGAAVANAVHHATGNASATCRSPSTSCCEAPIGGSIGDGAITPSAWWVHNTLGLHARPAWWRRWSRFDADVQVTDLTTGRGPVSGRSLNQVMALGVLRGHEVLVSAGGAQAQEALDEIRALARPRLRGSAARLRWSDGVGQVLQSDAPVRG